MIRLSLALVTLSMLVGLAACGPEPNSLSGSIDQNFTLDFTDVRLVRFSNGTTQLDYTEVLEDGTSNVVAKVVFDAPANGVQTDADIDIVANAGIVERVAGDGEFPDLERGVLRFLVGGVDPGPAEGEFAATFVDGKTLNGTFDTALEAVDL